MFFRTRNYFHWLPLPDDAIVEEVVPRSNHAIHVSPDWPHPDAFAYFATHLADAGFEAGDLHDDGHQVQQGFYREKTELHLTAVDLREARRRSREGVDEMLRQNPELALKL